MTNTLAMNIEKELKMNRGVIFTLTKGALDLGKKIKSINGFDLYGHKKYVKDNIPIKNTLKEELEEVFNNYKYLVFIMASGIVVRSIKDLIKSKDIDPGIVVVDERGQFVYSLLSGHLGGGNNLAKEISEITGGIPVISTASDVTNKIAVDTIAMEIDGQIKDLKEATKVTSLIVNNEKVKLLLPNNLIINNKNSSAGAVIISNRNKINISQIYPKNLVVGIGCKKETEYSKLLEAFLNLFEKYNLSLKSIKHLATVDIKKDEEAIIKLASYFEKELKIVDREEIKGVEDSFIGSDFVKEQIGVRAVSAPCAYLTSNKNGSFIVEKEKLDGITISIYEEDLEVEK